MNEDIAFDDEIAYVPLGMSGPWQIVPLDHYPGGEPYILTRPSWLPFTILLRPTSLNSFMAALFWVDALVDRGHEVPRLILPYLPGARQDRLNPIGDCLFTAKSVAREINARNFLSVTVLDPHSEVMPGMIDRCTTVSAAEVFLTPWGQSVRHGAARNYTAVIAPDGGAEKRASAVAKVLGLPLLRAWKTRDVGTGNITGFGVEPCDASGTYLLVDDICDGGGTFNGLADVMPNATLDLFVSHGIFSKGLDELRKRFRFIYTTNSIPHQPEAEDTVQIDVLPLLLTRSSQ